MGELGEPDVEHRSMYNNRKPRSLSPFLSLTRFHAKYEVVDGRGGTPELGQRRPQSPEQGHKLPRRGAWVDL